MRSKIEGAQTRNCWLIIKTLDRKRKQLTRWKDDLTRHMGRDAVLIKPSAVCRETESSPLKYCMDSLSKEVGQAVKKHVKKHLNFGHRSKKNVFVPANSPEVTFDHSVEPPDHLNLPTTSSQISSSGHSTSRSSSSTTPDLCSLSINTFGGEAAGSGYNWLTNEPSPPIVSRPVRSSRYAAHDAYHIIRAQENGLSALRKKIEDTRADVETARLDEQYMTEFIVAAYGDEIVANTPGEFEVTVADLKASIANLDEEISNLRILSPRAVPPDRPPAPRAAFERWKCVRCLDEMPNYMFRCKCGFPRPLVDPSEAALCDCPQCLDENGERPQALLPRF